MRYPPQVKTIWHHALQSLGLLFRDPYLLNIVPNLGYFVVGMENDVLREANVSLLSRKCLKERRRKKTQIHSFLKKIIFTCIYYFMNLFILYGDGDAHTTTCVQKPEDPLLESFLSLYHAVPRNQIQVTTLYSLGHLTSPRIH